MSLEEFVQEFIWERLTSRKGVWSAWHALGDRGNDLI